MTIALRDLTFADLALYRKLIDPKRAFHRLNGPYFGLPTIADQNRKIMEFGLELAKPHPHFTFRLIVDKETDRILGEVSYYWRDERTNWLEVGIVLFDEHDWGKGIGQQALPLWIDQQLLLRPALARIGLSTWSGNVGMVKLAKKIGLKLEARFRKARIVDGIHYDSLSFGILREEWEQMRAADGQGNMKAEFPL